MWSKALRCLTPHWPGQVTYSSDYFQQLYEFAIRLIQSGNAYVDHQTADEIKAYRCSWVPPANRMKMLDQIMVLKHRCNVFKEVCCRSRPAACVGAMLRLCLFLWCCRHHAHSVGHPVCLNMRPRGAPGKSGGQAPGGTGRRASRWRCSRTCGAARSTRAPPPSGQGATHCCYTCVRHVRVGGGDLWPGRMLAETSGALLLGLQWLPGLLNLKTDQ